ncbi:hypothetical protein A3F65_03945 [Candidatus Saccharibacteria bacterium RIFCSPHIGHO2_12_FULL_47_16b]|nr:MAG: hypothetical protein A3F65_03945 [Candidatus Saccharibacteria bacterium RIFCSPHIGHO2_12_FULL_47_16b]OGL39404.1 MAG: hypothetical protein A3J32_00605 [Candidatus Saccharibacteria bacterium RIFCSPLOWO2_02_FULL_46_7]
MNSSNSEDQPVERTVLSGMPGYYAVRLAVGIATEDEAMITQSMLARIEARDQALSELKHMGVEITDDARSPEEILAFLKDLDARQQDTI